MSTLLAPDTILRWLRRLVAQKAEQSNEPKGAGRPPLSQEIVDLVLQLARENPDWGYDRIQGALANLGHEISDQSVGNILKRHGVEPAPERKSKTSWSAFLKAHWDVLGTIDFTTVEVWTKSGLVTFYLVFVMELATRKVHFAGCTPQPDEAFMKQVARELTNDFDGFLLGKRHLIMDRDSKFSAAFPDILQQAGVAPVRLPPRSPNLNAHLERFFRTLKSECLDHMIFFGEGALRNAVAAVVEHYHTERNHQGLDNRIIDPGPEVGAVAGKIERRERLGGMLNYYRRAA